MIKKHNCIYTKTTLVFPKTLEDVGLKQADFGKTKVGSVYVPNIIML
jgi:hypothetical protein